MTGGREGSQFHYVGNGRFVMSVFHHERADIAKAKAANDPWTIVSGPNWHLWNYDPKTRTATEMQSVEWNSGAAYWFNIEGRELALVPTDSYASSNVYDLGQAPDQAKLLFGVDGWNIRLFKVR